MRIVYCVPVLQAGAATEVKWARAVVVKRESDRGCYTHMNTHWGKVTCSVQKVPVPECAVRLGVPSANLKTLMQLRQLTGAKVCSSRCNAWTKLCLKVVLHDKVLMQVLCADVECQTRAWDPVSELVHKPFEAPRRELFFFF